MHSIYEDNRNTIWKLKKISIGIDPTYTAQGLVH
jgi:hypothetical protein